MKYRTLHLDGNAYIVEDHGGRMVSVIARFENYKVGVAVEAGEPNFDQIVIDANKGADG